MVMFTVQLAGVNILINTVYTQTEMAFVDFITNEKYDYRIDVTIQRVNEERNLLQNTYPKKKFLDFEIEANALYRDIPKILIKENVILLHGVLICMEQKGYIFTAPSGTGKSTHVRLWRNVFGNKVKIINGDKPLLKLSDNGVFAYGSPWKGKEKIGFNLEQSQIKGLESSIVDRVRWFKNAAEHVTLYSLKCNISDESVKVAYCGMNS